MQFLAPPLLYNNYSLLTGYDLKSGIVSSIFQAILCKTILELEHQEPEINIDIGDDIFTNDLYMNEQTTNNPSLELQVV